MRLLLKLALLIGLGLFFLAPRQGDEDGMPAGLSAGALVFAAQQAVADIGGFCERAPLACESGRDAIHFAGARIVEGVTFVYGLAASGIATPPPVRAPAPTAVATETAAPEASRAAPPRQASASALPPPRPYIAPAG